MQSRLPSWGFGAEGESQLLFVPFKTEMQLDRPQEEAGLGSEASEFIRETTKGAKRSWGGGVPYPALGFP